MAVERPRSVQDLAGDELWIIETRLSTKHDVSLTLGEVSTTR